MPGIFLCGIFLWHISRDGTSEAFLKPRRDALAAAERAVLTQGDKVGAFNTRLYYIHCNSLTRRPDPGTVGWVAGVFGTVEIQVLNKAGNVVKKVNLFSRRDEGGSYVHMGDGHVESFPKAAMGGTTQIVLSLKPGEKAADYTVRVVANLYNNYGGDDHLMNNQAVKAFNLGQVHPDGAEFRENPSSGALPDDWGTFTFDCRATDMNNQWFSRN